MHVTTTQLATTARVLGVRLPFPFTDCGRDADDDTPVVGEAEPALRVIGDPKYVVYAVHERADATIDRVAAVEAMDDTAAALHVRGADAWLEPTTRDVLAKTVVSALDGIGAFRYGSLFDRDVAVPAHLLDVTDPDVVTAGLREARLPHHAIEAWHSAGRAQASGVLGVLGFDATGDHHVSRSVSWRAYAQGGVLAVELPTRSRREPAVSLRSLTARSLNRAAVDLLTSLHVEMAAASADMTPVLELEEASSAQPKPAGW